MAKETDLKTGVKHDLLFCSNCFNPAGLATSRLDSPWGRVEYGHVADMILTPWMMIGFGVLFGAAIIYTAIKSTLSSKKEDNANEDAGKSSHLSGKTVAIIVAFCVVALIVVVAYTILSDSLNCHLSG